jgi:hypothetical protein
MAPDHWSFGTSSCVGDVHPDAPIWRCHRGATAQMICTHVLVNNGIIDPETGEGFHGLIGLDFDGDQTVDVMTYHVGPDGDALPETAIDNGSPDHGIVDIGTVVGG